MSVVAPQYSTIYCVYKKVYFSITLFEICDIKLQNLYYAMVFLDDITINTRVLNTNFRLFLKNAMAYRLRWVSCKAIISRNVGNISSFINTCSGAMSVNKKCHLTNIGIFIMKIRWSHYNHIFIMEIFIAEEVVFILKRCQGAQRNNSHSQWMTVNG